MLELEGGFVADFYVLIGGVAIDAGFQFGAVVVGECGDGEKDRGCEEQNAGGSGGRGQGIRL